MLRLDSTVRKLQAVLAGAITTNQLPVVVCYSDKTATAYAGGTTVINTNSTIAVDICAAPAASTVRDIDAITVHNADTVAATVTVRYNDNGTTYTLFKAALAVGDQLIYTHGNGWKVLDSSGNAKATGGGGGDALTTNPLSQFAATTSAQLAGVITNETGSGPLVFATTPSFTTTIGVGGATASASGSGVSFPATQSASTDANTLDDYEEGTFTPTLVSTGGGTPTYSHQIGTYTKIGNRCLFTARIALSALGTLAAGTLTVAGLPFTSEGTANRTDACAFRGFNLGAAATTSLIAVIGSSTTVVNLAKYAAGTETSLPQSDLTATTVISLTGLYQTAG